MKESTAKPSSGQARSGEVARALIRTKQTSRRRVPAEEKIRIRLEGIRAEISVAELCRRESIPPHGVRQKRLRQIRSTRVSGQRARQSVR